MPKPVSSSSRFRKSGLAGSLLAVAAGTAAVMTANAQIYYSGLQDLSVTNTGAYNAYAVSLDGSGNADFTLAGFLSTASYTRITNYASGFKAVSSSASKIGLASFLALGANVGSSAIFNATYANIIGGPTLAPGGDTFIGFTFNPSASLPLYGWTQFSRSSDGSTLTLVDWAYDTTGASILTGAGEPTPEPTTLALSATGLALAGGRWYYRRRDRIHS